MLSSKLLKIIIGVLLISRIDGRPSVEENSDLFEGDIRFPDSSQRGVLRRGNSVAWTNGIVPYEISSNYNSTERSLIESTMQKMERLIAVNNVQCVHFRPRISSDQYYITIENEGGCSSFVGQNPRHTVTLEHPGCTVEGIIMHELLHTLGFYHEQSRPDRDNYIEVNYANIKPGLENNFEKYDSNTVDTQSTPYDYGSLMHYDSFSFSSNGHPTITPKQADAKIGQRYSMSAIDIQEVRLFYNCSSTGNTFPTISSTITTTDDLYRTNTTILSSLTINSSMYNRNYHVNQYYYESYKIEAPISGYYIFTSNSSIDTYSYFYEASFDPHYQLSNLIIHDDDAGGSNQFQFKEYLQANKTYVLVFTTYSSSVTGNYQLIVSGLHSVQITKLPSIFVSITTTQRSSNSSATKPSNTFGAIFLLAYTLFTSIHERSKVIFL